ncbi:sulfite exporter TauE/SafE family protein [Spiroplasma sp. SV19]|uniref:sulfite exporter TauE/SafE family protein n=1 Tax=Spiroplasma sp. SV19 TaxID=2570468 RepID=UPI0024B798F5|nr:sulfite exporter TauE/SafE family protein [Spiroplasma sp. SV19]
MLEKLKIEKQKIKKTVNTKTLFWLSGISLPLIIIGALLINYLIYFPKTRNQSFDSTKQEYLIAFIIVLITLLIIIGYFILMLKVVKKIYMDREKNIFKITAIGFVGSFLDTIGVGSFAVATAGLKVGKVVKNDSLLPGTLNIGLGIPNLIAGTVFVAAINVSVLTLVLLVIAAIFGSFIGMNLVKRISAKHISLTMALVLTIVGILMILTQLDLLPSGNKTALTGWQFALAFVLFAIYGGLQAFGIGLYAPALATIALLGMDIKVAFPIMTLASGSAFPIAAYSYYKNNKYQPKTGFGLMLGGSLGVVLAFLTVFVGIEVGLNVKPDVFTSYLKWLAIIVVFYVAVMLLLSYLKIRKKPDVNKIMTRSKIFLLENYDKWNQTLVKHLDDYLVSFYSKKQFYNDLINNTLGKEDRKKWK